MKNNIYKYSALIVCVLLTMGSRLCAQDSDDLLGALEKGQDSTLTLNYTQATFKGTHIINGQSVEVRSKGMLEFMIQHKFGAINSGAYNLYGLDLAVIRLGLLYGITDRLNVGIGRSSYEKTVDGYLKYKLIRQRQSGGSPVTVTAFASAAVNGLNTSEKIDPNNFSSRMAYTYQLLVARKFSPTLSLQLSPTLIHRNAVANVGDPNDIYAIGIGGRQKITHRLAISAEYYYVANPIENGSTSYHNALGLGLDIETGGHVFQLYFTNAQPLVEKSFIPETSGDFFNGDIHFGFNISRDFNLGRKSESKGHQKW